MVRLAKDEDGVQVVVLRETEAGVEVWWPGDDANGLVDPDKLEDA